MLASITPLGERSRHSHWSVTVTAFVLGAGAAGALIGALVGGLGALALHGSGGATTRLIAFAGAALVAIALDVWANRIPGPRRQVDERWLEEYRGWVYGLGYGTQLGLGVTTIVSSAATYLALVSAFLLGDVGRGAIVMGSYGLIRGLSVLLGATVRGPEQLVALHAMLERRRADARAGGVALLIAICAGALLGVAL